MNWPIISIILIAFAITVYFRHQKQPASFGSGTQKIRFYGVACFYFIVAIAVLQFLCASPPNNPDDDGWGDSVNLFPVDSTSKNYRVSANLVEMTNYFSFFTYSSVELTGIKWPNADDPIEVSGCLIPYHARILCSIDNKDYYVEVVR